MDHLFELLLIGEHDFPNNSLLSRGNFKVKYFGLIINMKSVA